MPGLSLEESARAAGAFRWAEATLFEILGGWVATTPEAEAKLLFDRHAQHHAWRAEQWWQRLPLLADVDRDELTTASSPEVAKAAEELRALEATVARLAGAYRFALPRLVTAYRRHRSKVTPVSDSSTIRTLDIVEADVASDWRDGELLLQKLLDSRQQAQAAAATVAALESVVVRPERQ